MMCKIVEYARELQVALQAKKTVVLSRISMRVEIKYYIRRKKK